MKQLKSFFRRNSHGSFFKRLASFGKALNKFYENRNHNIHSNGELVVLKKLSTLNPKVIIDGGANIGDYSLMANRTNPNCKVYAFEPVQNTYNELTNNTKGYNNIVPLKKGLFSSNCTKEINLFNSNQHSSIYNMEKAYYQSSEKSTIELVSGDDFMKENEIETIDFLKIDVEGAEYEAIKGFEKSFKEGKIKAIQFEYGYVNITTKKLLIDFHHLLEEYGYVVGKVFPKTVEFRDYKYKHEDFIGPNFIAVNKKELGLIQLLNKK